MPQTWACCHPSSKCSLILFETHSTLQCHKPGPAVIHLGNAVWFSVRPTAPYNATNLGLLSSIFEMQFDSLLDPQHLTMPQTWACCHPSWKCSLILFETHSTLQCHRPEPAVIHLRNAVWFSLRPTAPCNATNLGLLSSILEMQFDSLLDPQHLTMPQTWACCHLSSKCNLILFEIHSTLQCHRPEPAVIHLRNAVWFSLRPTAPCNATNLGLLSSILEMQFDSLLDPQHLTMPQTWACCHPSWKCSLILC